MAPIITMPSDLLNTIDMHRLVFESSSLHTFGAVRIPCDVETYIPQYQQYQPIIEENKKSSSYMRIHSMNIPFEVSQQTASCRCAHGVLFECR